MPGRGTGRGVPALARTTRAARRHAGIRTRDDAVELGHRHPPPARDDHNPDAGPPTREGGLDRAGPEPLPRRSHPRRPLCRDPGRDHYPYSDPVEPTLDEIEHFLTGARREPMGERVLATVLFTDVVRSTERAAELGDRRWRELLDRHDAVVAAELERFGGHAVKSLGDGLLATFDGPARAIRCARAVVDALAGLGLELRAGIHTGECERRGDDLGGIAVHIGARVAHCAAPGEVLVSATVKDLVFGSGLEFEDRGSRTLKGVPGKWRLYASDRGR